MRVIIAGDRETEDFQFLLDAIESAKTEGIEITEVVSGTARGADEMGEQWARLNNITITQFKPDWNNINHPDALVKVNQFGKKYNAKAGFMRNEQMAMYADAVIALQPNGNTNGTQDMIKRAKDKNLKLYVHTGRKEVNQELTGDEIPF